MNIAKSLKKIISLLLALVFISTNTAYSLERTLRIPLQQDKERLAATCYQIISRYPNLGRIAPATKERDENRRFRYVVLGTGIQGASVAYDLANQDDTMEIILVDKDIERAEKLAEALRLIFKNKIITVLQADLSDADALRGLFQKSDVVIGAAHYALNAELARVAAETGAHFVDMGGNTEVVLKELAYADTAITNGASIIPDMGLAPGLGGLLALDGIHEMDIVNDVKIRVGGLPSTGSKAFNNPLRYMLVFNIFGLINEYMGEALVIRDGKVVAIPTFSERESFEINGKQYEAFPTSGGTSTLTSTLTSGEFRGKVKNLDYMTIRYPGHAEIIKAFIEMGFFDETKVSLINKEASPSEFFSRLAKDRNKEDLFNKENIRKTMEYLSILSNDPIQFSETSISPRQFFAKLAEKALDFPGEKDNVIISVSVSGEKDGKPKTIEYYYDSSMAGAYGSRFSEMARTTGFPVSTTALMLARGQIKYVGASGPEHFVPTGLLIEELRKKGVGIDKRVIDGASVQKLVNNEPFNPAKDISDQKLIENHGVLVRDENGYSWVKRENSDSLKSMHIIGSLYKITDPKSALIIKSSL
jgi:lysine 6-dehydrogenase